jgi:hypothetical protein
MLSTSTRGLKILLQKYTSELAAARVRFVEIPTLLHHEINGRG